MKEENRLNDVPIIVPGIKERLNGHLDTLFNFYEGVSIVNLVVDIPTKEEIIDSVEDVETCDKTYSLIEKDCKSGVRRLIGVIIDETKFFGDYPHRNIPIKLDVLGYTDMDERGHCVTKLTLVIPDNDGTPFNDSAIKDVKVIYARLIKGLSQRLGLPEEKPLTDLVNFSGDASNGGIHGLVYLQNDRIKSDEEIKWDTHCKNISAFASDIYHLRNLMLASFQGVTTFLLTLQPFPIELMRKYSNYTEDEIVAFDALFREDPKVLMEMVLSHLQTIIDASKLMERRKGAPVELTYCIDPIRDADTDILTHVSIGVLVSADGVNDVNGGVLRDNPNFRAIFSAISMGYISYYGLEDLEPAAAAELVYDYIKIPTRGEGDEEITYPVYYREIEKPENVTVH